tara:strand:+ start:2351 stop:3670 length:1320 start_codon:yes stop_codon:yes gene_type:complete
MNKSWNIDRRTLLRGAGTCLALPWLEGMSWAAESNQSVARMAFFFFHYGVPMPPDDHPLRKEHAWFPTGEGKDFEFTGTHRSLEPFRDKLTYFGGLSHPLGRRVPGHKAGDVYLTGADISGSAYRQSISVDQVAANAVGDQTRFSSLVMSSAGGINRPYRSATLSYDRDGRAIPAQNNPREIFRRLFGEESGDQQKKLANQASVLDTILGEAKSLNRRLGKRDQEKMDEYLSSVREVELRVDRAQEWLDVPKPSVEMGSVNLEMDQSVPKEYLRTMFDLVALSLQTDSTRVATFQLAGENGEGPEALYPHAVGISKTSHSVSHARTDYEQWSNYNRLFADAYAYFLERLNGMEDANGENLLDNTMSMLGCCTSQTHLSRNYPLIFSGGGNLGFEHGQYRKYDENEVPLSNLFVTMLDKMGTGEEKFQDSKGALTELLKS